MVRVLELSNRNFQFGIIQSFDFVHDPVLKITREASFQAWAHSLSLDTGQRVGSPCKHDAWRSDLSGIYSRLQKADDSLH